MTDRKPAGMQFETWIDRQIRESQTRGEFDNLPGAGKPLPDAGEPYHEMWWLNRKLRDERITSLPPSLVLRKDAHDAHEAALAAPTDEEAERVLTEINVRIAAAIRNPPPGPLLNLVPFNVRAVLKERRKRR